MEKYFITDDTALAAYLYLCGVKFVAATIWPRTGNRKQYIMYNQPTISKMEEDFYLRKTAVAPMDYHDARIRVSRFLRQRVVDPRLEELEMLN